MPAQGRRLRASGRRTARARCERGLRLLLPPERAVGERQRVVRRAELGKERDRALEVFDGGSVRALRRRNASEAELPPPARVRVGQRGEQPLALVEIAGVEQRFGELQPCRQVVRRDRRAPARVARPRRPAAPAAAAPPRRGSATRTCAARAPAPARRPRARRPTAPRRAARGRARPWLPRPLAFATASRCARAIASRAAGGYVSSASVGSGGAVDCADAVTTPSSASIRMNGTTLMEKTRARRLTPRPCRLPDRGSRLEGTRKPKRI